LIVICRIPPPHLSPFVDNEAVGYIPDYAEKIKQLTAAARRQIMPVPDVGTDVDDTQNVLLEGVASRVEAKEAAERKQEVSPFLNHISIYLYLHTHAYTHTQRHTYTYIFVHYIMLQ